MDHRLKICKKCNKEKKLYEFKKQKNCTDGRRGTCKQCINDANRMWPIIPEGKLICKKCLFIKNIDEFVLAKNCKTGYRNKCKKCERKRYQKKGNAVFNKSWFKPGKEHPLFIDGKNLEHHRIIHNKSYRRIRDEVMKRDNYQCAMCKAENKLQVHHIIPLRENPLLGKDMNNLVTLCPKCHVDADKNNIKRAQMMLKMV